MNSNFIRHLNSPRLSHFVFLLFGLCGCCLVVPHLAAQDSAIGTPVYISIRPAIPGVGSSWSLSATITGLVPGTYPVNGTPENGTTCSASETLSVSGTPSLPISMISLQPHHIYSATITSTNYDAVTLSIAAPPGYQAVINGLVQGSGTVPTGGYSTNTISMTFAVIPAADFSAGAGECSEIASNQVHWQVSLGSLFNGMSAGTLSLSDLGNEGSWSMGTVGTLYLIPTAAETPSTVNPNNYYAFGSGSYVYGAATSYIYTHQALVVLTSGLGATNIAFYTWSSLQVPAMSTAPFAALTSSDPPSPYISYQITVPSPDQIQITSTTATRYAITTLTRVSGDGVTTPFSWSLAKWNTNNGSAPLLTETRNVTSGSPASWSEIHQALQSGVEATTVNNSYSFEPWGAAIVSSTLGSSDPTGISTIAYNTSSSANGYGFPMSMTNEDGSWATYQYSSSGTPLCAMPSTLAQPYGNSPMALQTDGVVTSVTYALDEFGLLSQPGQITKVVAGTTMLNSALKYAYGSQPGGGGPNSMANGVPLTTITETDTPGSGAPLTTISELYTETQESSNGTPYFPLLIGQTHSITKTDSTKTCFVYLLGGYTSGSGWSPAFNANVSTYSASFVAEITGTSNGNAPGATQYAAYIDNGISYQLDAVNPIYLVSGYSTLKATIRDQTALIVRTESYVWSGSNWTLIGWVNLTNDAFGHVTQRQRSNLATYTAQFTGELLSSETDETGASTDYVEDAAGRIVSSSRLTASGGTMKTAYTYDGANRITNTTVTATNITESLVQAVIYDDAGRMTSNQQPGLGATSYTYNVPGLTRTTQNPFNSDGSGGGSEEDTYQLDGRLASVAGSAVVAENYSYSILSATGAEMQTASTGTAMRYKEVITDAFGRIQETIRPGFGGIPALNIAGQQPYTEKYSYGPTTGQLTTVMRSGLASTLYQYDPVGQVLLRALDMDGNGTYDTNTDRISEANHFIESWSGSWWDHVDEVIYPTTGAGSSIPMTVVTKRTRLTGFATGELAETNIIDAYQNQVIQKVSNPSPGVILVSTTDTGVAAPETETIAYGLKQSLASSAGLITTYQYDGLDRLSSITDPQNNSTTTKYYSGTALESKVTDGAGNATNFGYDAMGRQTSETNALGFVKTVTYDAVGRVIEVSGTGAHTVQYSYDPVYGDRQTIATQPGSGGWATTTWAYDAASGLVISKKDPGNNVVYYNYNGTGRPSARVWARGVTSNYQYDPNTGELIETSYSDGTPPVGYSYTRFGSLLTVTDATGSRTFGYGSNNPNVLTELDTESLDTSFYSSRVLTTVYNSVNGSGETNGLYVPGYVPGRTVGFTLGSAGSPSRDLQQNLTYSNIGQLMGVHTVASASAAKDIYYAYGQPSGSNGSYAGLMSGYSIANGANSTFSVSYLYDPQRPLMTSVRSQWSGSSTPITQFDYTNSSTGQRLSEMKSGAAFGDYYAGMSYSHVYRTFNYDGFGELSSSAMYRGDIVNPNAADQLPGQAYYYGYDAAGNRLSAGEAGTKADEQYAPDSLDQYSSKENNLVRILGTSSNSAVVTTSPVVPGGTVQLDRVFGAGLVPPNANAATAGTVTVTGTTTSASYSAPPAAYIVGSLNQALTYDPDGNLTSDGVWNYTYDAENRLHSMVNAIPEANGAVNTIQFTYDYLGRRVEKSVSSSLSSFDHRYVYLGMSLIAEINTSSGNITRSYTWGSGPSGTLLELTNFNSDGTTTDYWPTYDANGNVASLVRSTDGFIAAIYEYGPFGEILRSQANDAAVADNPFRYGANYADIETGLVYFGQRYYSPTLGRFINRDPIEEAGGTNLYGFCGNDPVNETDYLGLLPSIQIEEDDANIISTLAWQDFWWHGRVLTFLIQPPEVPAWVYYAADAYAAAEAQRVANAAQSTNQLFDVGDPGDAPVVMGTFNVNESLYSWSDAVNSVSSYGANSITLLSSRSPSTKAKQAGGGHIPKGAIPVSNWGNGTSGYLTNSADGKGIVYVPTGPAQASDVVISPPPPSPPTAPPAIPSVTGGGSQAQDSDSSWSEKDSVEAASLVTDGAGLIADLRSKIIVNNYFWVQKNGIVRLVTAANKSNFLYNRSLTLALGRVSPLAEGFSKYLGPLGLGISIYEDVTHPTWKSGADTIFGLVGLAPGIGNAIGGAYVLFNLGYKVGTLVDSYIDVSGFYANLLEAPPDFRH